MPTRRRLQPAIAAVAGLAIGCTASHVAAEERLALDRPHGVLLTREATGPGAGGFIIQETVPGGVVIRDDSTLAFARQVLRPAQYDGFRVAGPHLLIEGVRFTGPIDIYTRLPVVMRGTIVRPWGGAHWAIHVRPQAGPFFFLWSEAGGDLRGPPVRGKGAVTDIGLMLRADGAKVYRSRISHAIDGIRPGGSRISIVNNVIDELVTYAGAHNDGIQILGQVADIAIVGNRIINPHPQTSALSLLGDHVRVERNWLAGGGWTVYGGARGHHTGARPSSYLSITDNILGRKPFRRSGHFGVLADWSRMRGNTWSRNRFETGEPFSP